MPRRFFKRLSRKRHSVHGSWYMRPFQAMLDNPAYWSVHRTNVTRAVALGILVAFIPLPIHIPTVVALALLLQVNLPVAMATIFISNPLTMLPQYYLCYQVGSALLNTPMHEFAFEMSWQWIETELLAIWKPFLLGCLVLGAGSALAAYSILGSLWHFSLVRKYHRRKRKGRSTNAVNAGKSTAHAEHARRKRKKHAG